MRDEEREDYSQRFGETLSIIQQTVGLIRHSGLRKKMMKNIINSIWLGKVHCDSFPPIPQPGCKCPRYNLTKTRDPPSYLWFDEQPLQHEPRQMKPTTMHIRLLVNPFKGVDTASHVNDVPSPGP